MGTMPDATGDTFAGVSQTCADFPPKTPYPRPPTQLTIGAYNEMGTKAIPRVAPPIDLIHEDGPVGLVGWTPTRRSLLQVIPRVIPPKDIHKPNYSLGTEPCSYVTQTMEATAPPPPRASLAGRAAAAGEKAVDRTSEVERGFRQPSGSAEFNIVHSGERLGADARFGGHKDSALAARNARAADVPVGRRTCPEIPPQTRGPLGTRQSYDLITGADRPPGRW